MTLLHDAYAALLSGLTHKANNEIHWVDEYGRPITIEPIDINQEKYIVREYYENGNKKWELEYQNDQLHGKSIWWDANGNKCWEDEYQNGLLHGKTIGWNENGSKWCEKEYQNNQLHGKSIAWHENGNKRWEHEWENGRLIRTIL